MCNNDVNTTQNLQISYWPVERLVPYARNPRKNDAHVERMAGVIQEFGFRIPIIAKDDGVVVDGHLRLKAAMRLGITSVPVVSAEGMTDAQIKAFRLLANKSVAWSEWDEELLALEMQELQSLDFDLALTGFEAAEIEELFETPEEAAGLTDEDAVPEPPVDPVTRPGDLWLLGEHRLLCGDATRLDHFDRLLDGSHAAMIFTDPPYNVDYEGKAGRIKNDKLGGEFARFLTYACAGMLAHVTGAVYVCMSSSELHTLREAFIASGGKWSTLIIWAKTTFTLGRSDYQRQYEPILYGWRQGVKRFWCGARDQGDVWQAAKPRVNDLHPTMKPVELVERAIRNSSRTGDIVLDPFAGSGTTLIACEKTGRICRTMEIDPKFCDVIIRRWEEFTGKKAELEGAAIKREAPSE